MMHQVTFTLLSSEETLYLGDNTRRVTIKINQLKRFR